MKLSLAYSPCPNDTFIFWGLATRRIESQIEYQVDMRDVEELNQHAQHDFYDITKLSFNALGQVSSKYQILDSGAALGINCGPILIARSSNPGPVSDGKILLPGLYTTAHLLFSMAYPTANNKEFVLFSEIETRLVRGEADFGVIIHESRFTFHQKGLFQIRDLGQFWEETTHCPIPLGGIGIRRNLSQAVKLQVESDVSKSLILASDHPDEVLDYCRAHAQEMDDAVMKQHIELYVNAYSRSLGESGKSAIDRLFGEMKQLKLVDELYTPTFLD